MTVRAISCSGEANFLGEGSGRYTTSTRLGSVRHSVLMEKQVGLAPACCSSRIPERPTPHDIDYALRSVP